MSQEILV